jgi:hypothetical protein
MPALLSVGGNFRAFPAFPPDPFVSDEELTRYGLGVRKRSRAASAAVAHENIG